MELFGSGGLIILGLAVILFGAKKLPELARSLGRAQGEFKKGLKEGVVDDEPTSEPAKPAEPTGEGSTS